MKTCFIHFCKQGDRSCTLCAINVTRFMLLMLGLHARNSEWNLWYAAAITIFVNSTSYS